MMTQPFVALDLGSTKVACAVGQPREQGPGFELLGSSIVPYPTLSDAWLSDPLLVGRTIEQALEATAVTADFHRALVAVSHPALASEQVKTSIHLGDEPVTIREQDLNRMKLRALDQVLGVDREPLVVERLSCSGNGFEGVREPLGLTATRLSGVFHVVTMPIAARRAIVQAVESSGLEVMQLTFSLQAAAATLVKEQGRRGRVLLIDLGGLNTDVGLFVEEQLEDARTVRWGGLAYALHIAKTSQITLDQAVTLSLEGLSSRKPGIRQLLKQQLESLEHAIRELLLGRPLPDAILVTGRGALIDGMVEWIEDVTQVKTSVARSPRTQTMGELSRQIGLTGALGLLEMATESGQEALLRSPRLVDRVIDRTRTILTEYF